METVAGRHKMFLVAQDSQTLIDPIKNGRCVRISIPAPDSETMQKMLLETMRREQLNTVVDLAYERTQLEKLAESITLEAKGDLKKAFWLLHASFAKKDGEAKQVHMVNVPWLDGVRKIVEMVAPKRIGDDRPVLDGVRLGGPGGPPPGTALAGAGAGATNRGAAVGEPRPSVSALPAGLVNEQFLKPASTTDASHNRLQLNHTAINEQQIDVTCDFNSNENLNNRDKEFPFETIIHETNRLLVGVPALDVVLALRDGFLRQEFWRMRPCLGVDLVREACLTGKRLGGGVLGASSSPELHVLAFVSHAIEQVLHAKRLVDDRHMRRSLLEFYRARQEEEADPTLAKRRKEKFEGELKTNWKLI